MRYIGDVHLAYMPFSHSVLTVLGAVLLAFLLELGYRLLCWRVFGGGKALLAIIVGFNLANLSLFLPAIPGPEELLAGRLLLLVTVILAQIAVTLWAVW